MKVLHVVSACVALSLSGFTGAIAADPFSRTDDHSTKGLSRVTGPTYANANYGYALRLPNGLTGWTDTPPSPIHGLNIYLGPKRSIEVEASFDSALLGSTDALADDVVSQFPGAAQTTRSKQALGNHAAVRVQQAWSATGRYRVAVVAWTGQGTKGDAINYVLTLETTKQNFVRDKQTFDAIAASFRFIPRI